MRTKNLSADVQFHIAAPLRIPPAAQNAGAANNIGVAELPQGDED
jgi:hypothetical protein